MWILLIIGGGIIVTILGPISITGYGVLDPVLSSIVKFIAALLLTILWISILSKMKTWIFNKMVQD